MSQIVEHNTPLRYMTPQRWNRSRELHPAHVESDPSSTGERHGTPATGGARRSRIGSIGEKYISLRGTLKNKQMSVGMPYNGSYG